MARFGLLFSLVLMLTGCGTPGPEGVAVFAAASTREGVESVARTFTAATGTPVRITPAATNVLARQIEQGAPADLFFSADEEWADYLAARGLVVRRRDLLANRLVVVTSADRPMNLRSMSDLARPEIRRLAIAGESVPAGTYARQALRGAGIWEAVKGRLLEGGDVRETLSYVLRGEAEAGIVYATDARAAGERVQVAFTVPQELHQPIRYPLVLVRRLGAAAAAERFFQYLEGEEAAANFRQLGFEVLQRKDEG
jgi:molybdate transport system substrate-binding protein